MHRRRQRRTPFMSLFRGINLLALVLCFVVVVFGAYVRLSNAGLGCPDWPGCYGHLTVTAAASSAASDVARDFPTRPVVEAPKAWKEMIHRYLATTLGTLLLILAALTWLVEGLRHLRGLTLALIGTVCLQGALGALTVLWNVNPVTVTGHLLVGLTTLALLWWLWLRGTAEEADAAPARREREARSERQAWFNAQGQRQTAAPAKPAPWGLRAWAVLALVLVVGQIFLGGWTSSNYAALACPDFPTCLGSFAPQTGIAQVFKVWHGTGANYEYGILDGATRATIHLMHRYGALLLFLIIFTWTPPHFWALAIERHKEYADVDVPMLPVTHGLEYTRLQVLLYTILLLVVSVLPFVFNMSGLIYLAGALVLGVVFLVYAIRLKWAPRPSLPMKTFGYSIVYLMGIFTLLFADHYIR